MIEPKNATPATTAGGGGRGEGDSPGRAEAALLDRFGHGPVRVGIIGLGYVGLPLALAFVDRGLSVLGFDTDAAKVARLRRGESYIGHIPDGVIRRMGGRFEATDRFERLGEADAVIICVPTPLTEARDPDLSYIVKSAEAIAARLRPGQLVVLESTTYPGTTREVVRPILEAGGLRAGADFFLAFSPEREDPGNPDFSAPTIPKVVGGIDPRSRDLAAALYGRVVGRVVPVSSCEVAEACKILENTYRAVNIALVNELKVLYDRMGINVWEVIEAARTKPFGFQAFYPGPGLGGHCLAGSETARVRGPGIDTVLPLADLFERVRGERVALQLGDVEVLEPTGLETLSIDTSTGRASWKTVSHLFRRRFRGTMLEIQLAGNRVLRTTDRHPMLVVADDQLEIREARDLKSGDLVPLFTGLVQLAESEGEDLPIDLLAGLPASLVDRLHVRLQDVPGVRHQSLLKARHGSMLRHGTARTAGTWSEGRALAVVGLNASKAEEFVYSLEVPGTNTFATTGGVFVHNCIPIDPFYLSWVARKHGLTTRFIELAGEINTSMPAFVVAKVADALNDRGKPLKGSRIGLLGMAYKKDVDDPRESPGFELMDLLLGKGAEVSYNDPHIPALPPMRKYPHLRMASRELSVEYLGSLDCVLVVTDHSAYDWPWIAAHAPLIVDTRNALRAVIAHRERVVRA